MTLCHCMRVLFGGRLYPNHKLKFILFIALIRWRVGGQGTSRQHKPKFSFKTVDELAQEG